MKNFSKGWFTTALGFIIMGCVIAHYFGIYTFPSPSMIGKPTEAIIGFLFGLFLFLVPHSKIENFFGTALEDGYFFLKNWIIKKFS